MWDRLRARVAWADPLLPVAAVLLATLLLVFPILRHHPNLPRGDDALWAVHVATGFTDALGEGVLYPRWLEASNLGMGGPFFVFYSPLAYWAAGGLALAFGDVLAGLRWTVVLAGLLAGLGFWAAFRHRAPPAAVAAGAALYVVAPYHVLDLYWRFAFAEYVAFAWLPLLFLFARRVVEGRGAQGVAGLALCYAGLLFTHVLTAFLAPLVLGPYLLARLLRSRRWSRLAPLAAAGVVGVTLAGAYVVPMLAQRPWVHLEWVRDAPYGDYRRNFAFRDETRLGYEAAPVKPYVNRAAATQGLLAAAALALLLAPRRRSRDTDASPDRDEALAYGAVAGWVLFLQVPASAPVWALVPELPTVQFPWRFQTFQAFSTCALVTLAGAALARSGGRGARIRGAVLSAAALPALWAAATMIPPEGISFGRERARGFAARRYVALEYVPHYIRSWGHWKARWGDGIPPARLEPDGHVAIRRWDNHQRILEVSTARPARLLVRSFVYPGWTARLDGEPVPIEADDRLGAMQIAVPTGRHTVALRFERTPDRTLGLYASAAGALLLIATAARSRRRR